MTARRAAPWLLLVTAALVAGAGLRRRSFAGGPAAPPALAGFALHDPRVRQPLADELDRIAGARAGGDAQGPRRSFTQIFVDQRRRGEDAAVVARRWLQSLRDGHAEPGDASVLPAHWSRKSEAQIAHLLGPALSREVMRAPAGAWIGPLRSPFGLHLLRVDPGD